MAFTYEEFDLSGVRTYPLESRKSKTKAEDFGRPGEAGATIRQLVDSLPNVLAATHFKAVKSTKHMRGAR